MNKNKNTHSIIAARLLAELRSGRGFNSGMVEDFQALGVTYTFETFLKICKMPADRYQKLLELTTLRLESMV